MTGPKGGQLNWTYRSGLIQGSRLEGVHCTYSHVVADTYSFQVFDETALEVATPTGLHCCVNKALNRWSFKAIMHVVWYADKGILCIMYLPAMQWKEYP